MHKLKSRPRSHQGGSHYFTRCCYKPNVRKIGDRHQQQKLDKPRTVLSYKDSHIPSAMTSNSQMFMWSLIGNWTMRYLNGAMLEGQNRETVAAEGTSPGYWPHRV